MSYSRTNVQHCKNTKAPTTKSLWIVIVVVSSSIHFINKYELFLHFSYLLKCCHQHWNLNFMTIVYVHLRVELVCDSSTFWPLFNFLLSYRVKWSVTVYLPCIHFLSNNMSKWYLFILWNYVFSSLTLIWPYRKGWFENFGYITQAGLKFMILS